MTKNTAKIMQITRQMKSLSNERVRASRVRRRRLWLVRKLRVKHFKIPSAANSLTLFYLPVTVHVSK